MLIKLLEQPIIALKDARIVGFAKGLTLEENKVVGVYSQLDALYFTVPVQSITIGPDAFILEDISRLQLASELGSRLDSMTEAYNLQGVHIGSILAVDVEEDFTISALQTERCKFEYSKLARVGEVVIADVSADELQTEDSMECQRHILEEEAQKLKSEVEACIDYNLAKTHAQTDSIAKESIDGIGFEKSMEIKQVGAEVKEAYESVDELKSTLRTVQELHRYEAVNVHPAPGASKQEDSVDQKYKYLCGKKLLEDVEINGRGFEKGSNIDIDMIKYSIENNAIVKVIMNAED